MITDMLAPRPFPASVIFQDVEPAILEAEDRQEAPMECDAWAMFMQRLLEFPTGRDADGQ
jgi:hypothetical protein